MINSRHSFLAILVLLVFVNATALAQNKTDKFFLTAMNDELKRNMDSLQLNESPKPFFIGYGFSRGAKVQVSSMLGAVISAEKAPVNQSRLRLMVGDYQVNDENFRNIYGMGIDNPFGQEFASLPIDTDYTGIRRVYWQNSDQFYREANNNYKLKKEYLKKYDMNYPVPDFDKEVPVVRQFFPDTTYDVDIEEIKTYSNEISSYFVNYPNIGKSSVNFSNIRQYNYFINSEGTSLGYPSQLSVMEVRFTKLKSVPEYNVLKYIWKDVSEIPAKEQVIADIQLVLSFQDDSIATKISKLEDDYEGVVLLEGQAVADFFMENLLSREASIIAQRVEIINDPLFSYEKYLDNIKKDSAAFGNKKVANSQITITEKPFLKEWNGTRLLGTYFIDGEGVIPPEELILVKDGILINQLNNRVPTVGMPHTNGHYRHMLSTGNVSYNKVAPGVLIVEFSEAISEEEILKKFETLIEEDDLEFGVRINSPLLSASMAPLKFHKHMADSYEDKELHPVNGAFNQVNGLKKIISASDSLVAYNYLYPESGPQYEMFDYYISTNWLPVSIIVPSSILVKNYHLTGSGRRSHSLFDSFFMNNGSFEDYTPPIKGPLEK